MVKCNYANYCRIGHLSVVATCSRHFLSVTPRARNGRKQAAQDAGRGGERAAEAAQPPKRAAASKPAPRPPTARNPTAPMAMVGYGHGWLHGCSRPARRSAPDPHGPDARGAGPPTQPADRRPRPEARGRDRRRTRPREARAPTRTTPRGRARARRTPRRESPERRTAPRGRANRHTRGFFAQKQDFAKPKGKILCIFS